MKIMLSEAEIPSGYTSKLGMESISLENLVQVLRGYSQDANSHPPSSHPQHLLIIEPLPNERYCIISASRNADSSTGQYKPKSRKNLSS